LVRNPTPPDNKGASCAGHWSAAQIISIAAAGRTENQEETRASMNSRLR